MDAFTQINWSQFHLIRPYALLLIPILVIFHYWVTNKSKNSSGWSQLVDKNLFNWLIIDNQKVKKNNTRLFGLFVYASILMAALAASGPTWVEEKVPVSASASHSVIVLDLSPSMKAEDMVPNRLQNAKFKIMNLLQNWREGLVSLVAYSNDGYVIAPLTDDTQTIINLIPVLDPSIMPGQGSAVDKGIEQAIELLNQAGFHDGDILLVTDGISAKRLDKINDILDGKPYRLSVIGIGSIEGAPIPNSDTGQFTTDASGAIIIAKLDESNLKTLTIRQRGLYQKATATDDDVNLWLNLINTNDPSTFSQLKNQQVTQWLDMGAYFLWPLLFIVAYFFRQGVLFSFLLISIFSLQSHKIYATNTPDKLEQSKPPLQAEKSNEPSSLEKIWNALWYKQDQLGDKALKNDDFDSALKYFDKPLDKGNALYRARKYDEANETYAKASGAIARYNQGNALAQLQKYDDAIQSYEEALKEKPEFPQAKKNIEIVKALKKQQQNKENKDNKDNKDQKNKQEQQKDQSQQQDQKDNNMQKNNDEQNTQQQDPKKDQQDNDQSQNKDDKDKNADKDREQNKEQQAKQADDPKDQDKKDVQSLNKDKDKDLKNQQEENIKQWLRQIPDDPAILLRNKLKVEQNRRAPSTPPSKEEQEW